MNSTIESMLEKIIAELAEIKVMIAQGGATVARHAPAERGEVASDDLMNREWADMTIQKDPPRSKFPSQVGKKMSECPPGYLLDYASFYEWKAEKGREETPVRLNNKGKPWHESDSLIAKVARGWAARLQDKPGVAKAKPKTKTPARSDSDEDVPF